MSDNLRLVLRPVSNDKVIRLPASNGQDILADADDVFYRIDPLFKYWDTKHTGRPTPTMSVSLYEMKLRGEPNLNRVFSRLTELISPLDKLCLSQSQIKRFVQLHQNWLRPKNQSLLLFEAAGAYFVAGVHIIRYSLRQLELRCFKVSDTDFLLNNTWYRLIVPATE